MSWIGRTVWDDFVFVGVTVGSIPVVLVILQLCLNIVLVCVKGGRELLRDKRDVPEVVDKLVHSKMQSDKVQQFRSLCKVLCVPILVSNSSVMFNVSTGNVRYSTMVQDVVQLCLQTLFLAVALVPRVTTPRSLELLYCTLMTGLSALVTPLTCDPRVLMPAILATTTACLLLTGVKRAGRRWPIVAPCNLLFAACSSCTLYVHGGDCFTHPKTLALLQVCMIAGITWAAQLAERSIASMIKNSFRFQEATELYTAACALLKSCCEVVFEIDLEGFIVSPSLNLSSFLLHGPNQSLSGTQLSDLIADAQERETFLQRLSAPNFGEIGLAQNMPVSMRDSDNNVLRLEFLWFPVMRSGGQARYMIGIREILSHDMPVLPTEKQHSSSNDGSARSTRNAADGLGDLVEFAASSSSSRSSHQFAEAFNEARPGTTAVVAVDCSEAQLPVRGSTTGFSSRIGRIEQGTPLLNLISNWDSFSTWMNISLRAVRKGMAPLTDQQVIIQTPTNHVEALCRMMPELRLSSDASEVVEVDEGCDVEHMCMLFHHVKQIRNKNALRSRRQAVEVKVSL